jgi:hypothetical protein
VSGEVIINRVIVGRVVCGNTLTDIEGRLCLSLGFKMDHVGMMHAQARELDKDQDDGQLRKAP